MNDKVVPGQSRVALRWVSQSADPLQSQGCMPGPGEACCDTGQNESDPPGTRCLPEVGAVVVLSVHTGLGLETFGL